MYAEQAFASYANAAFNEIRNTPLESLNTAAFRARLGDALRSIAEESGANESNSEDYGRIASVYHVHFLPPCPAESGEGLAEVYTFDGFPGLYLVRNYLTEGQRDALMCQTLTDYINTQPPNNSNLLQNDANVATPIWPSRNFKKLRWATIGHMYDWGARSYRGFTEFPEPLVNLTRQLLSHFNDDYVPDAAIINCYTKGYFLRLHKDDAEETDDTVVNISLGAPAIFAIGGRDHSTVPAAMVVDSGSVVLMARDSRFCLHGVVKLLSYKKPGCHDEAGDDKDEAGGIKYAEPRLAMAIPQCSDETLSGLRCEPDALQRARTLSQEVRVSVSIRRAKRRAENQ